MATLRDKPIKELTIRRYEKPLKSLELRDLVRKFCLSIGLLQPGDTRDIIVDIFTVLLLSDEPLSSKEIQKKVIEQRKNEKKTISGISESNIRWQLRKLRELFLIEKKGAAYMINENESLNNLINEMVRPYIIEPIIQRIFDYAKEIDKRTKRSEEE